MADNSGDRVRLAASLLFRAGDVVELRVPKAGREKTISGYFRDAELLALAAEQLEKRRFPGIYWTLNPVNPDLLARAENKVKPFAGETTADADIVHRAWLPVDLDPVRPTGISSNQEQHAAALKLAEHVRAALLVDGWEEPLFADSGNGAHLLYPISLPNDTAATDLLSRVLRALAARFSTDAIKVDEGIFNASRIFKVYGTTARKGDHTDDRPHRASQLLDVPALLKPVSDALLHSIAALAPPDPKRRSAAVGARRRWARAASSFDVEGFLARHGVRFRPPLAYNGGLKWVLEECPWDASHKYPDAAVFERGDGVLGFRCLHNSCHGRDWRELRALFEGPRAFGSAAHQWKSDDGDKNSPASADAEEAEPSGRPAEVPLNAIDVESAVAAACEAKDWDAVARLIPEIAKVPLASYTLIVGKLRSHFKRVFPAKEFSQTIKAMQEAQAAPPQVFFDDDPPPDAPDLIGFPLIPLTDSGNGERLVKLYGEDIRFCAEFKKWLMWDGRRWVVDTDAGVVTQRAKNVARLLYQQAAQITDEKLRHTVQAHARDSESQGAISAALLRAKSEPGMALSAADLDQHRYLVNCMNGVVDARTGEKLPFERRYYMTKLCAYDYKPDSSAEKDCPRFLKYLHWTMGETPEMGELPERVTRMVAFLQKAFGYALTGDVSEKAAFIFYGARGNNGKTTLLTLFSTLLSEYSTQLDINTLMTSKFTDNNVRADLARLHGARFVITSEVDDGQRLSERLMKYLTSGMGKVTACRKFENPFEFLSTHKIFMDCNYRPEVKGADEAIWSRLKCVPFLQRIEESDPVIDKQLVLTLLAEAEGILAWAIRGTMRWWKEKSLGDPVEVKEAGAAWREADDPLKPFLEECCELGPDHWVRCKDFTKAYQGWCKDNNEIQLKSSRLLQRLALKGIQEDRSTRREGLQVRCWTGVKLRDDVTLISSPRWPTPSSERAF